MKVFTINLKWLIAEECHHSSILLYFNLHLQFFTFLLVVAFGLFAETWPWGSVPSSTYEPITYVSYLIRLWNISERTYHIFSGNFDLAWKITNTWLEYCAIVRQIETQTFDRVKIDSCTCNQSACTTWARDLTKRKDCLIKLIATSSASRSLLFIQTLIEH